jgi:hypothetical protein
MAIPIRRQAMIGTIIGSSARLGKNLLAYVDICARDPASTAAAPSIRPPDKSAPPDRITNIHPMAMISLVEDCIKISRNTRRDRNAGFFTVIMIIIAIKTR